ncbi:myosin-2 heavy chain-like [Zingiber officinale]|uniref:myosin-2 heavy chain-like n=1 Tax=Zingiber officinale TaxID=94328 RepID=UPI001C4BB4A1|nr:myosin-2 heavy chain-like [Zingiber officinale]
MASSSEGADDGVGSLFEGMVLFSSSIDLSLPQVDESPPSAVATVTSQPPPSPQSKALDEDLFSDLTLQAPSSPPPVLDSPKTTPIPQSSTVQPLVLVSRQASRKKKRAVRIGYARESLAAASLDDARRLSDPSFSSSSDPPSAIGTTSDSKAPMVDETPIASSPRSVGGDVGADPHQETDTQVEEDDPPPASPSPEPLGQQKDEGSSYEVVVKGDSSQPPPDGVEEATLSVGESAAKGDVFGSAEERLLLVRARISEKLQSIRKKTSSAYAERKELERKRRMIVESVNTASSRHKDLESELEIACESEDFEKAEKVSNDIAAVEVEKDKLLLSLKDAEADCERAESKMQEVLEEQIVAEEEGITQLEQFAKVAADNADCILKNAEEVFNREQEEWQSSAELLDIKKLEMNVESQLISEVQTGLENAIEDLVKHERAEKEILTRKGVILAKELDELLQLVRLKEAEIAENKSQIENVEERISNTVSLFNESRSSIETKLEDMQSASRKVESENDALVIRQKEINEVMCSAQKMRGKIMELSSVSSDEAKTYQDSVVLKKKLASLILKSREDRVRFSKTEENILEDIQILRQQISAARSALQELSSTRASIQQEVSLFKQRIGFIEKRVPELEAEKKVAATARNFKEAGRVAAEAKALQSEKEDLQDKLEKAVLHLEKLEEDIKGNVDKIQDNEVLLSVKEKEAALAGCNRLQLVALAARAESLAALQLGDVEEGNILLKEAEAAESKVIELQKDYDLDMEVDGNNLLIKLDGIELSDFYSSGR